MKKNLQINNFKYAILIVFVFVIGVFLLSSRASFASHQEPPPVEPPPVDPPPGGGTGPVVYDGISVLYYDVVLPTPVVTVSTIPSNLNLVNINQNFQIHWDAIPFSVSTYCKGDAGDSHFDFIKDGRVSGISDSLSQKIGTTYAVKCYNIQSDTGYCTGGTYPDTTKKISWSSVASNPESGVTRDAHPSASFSWDEGAEYYPLCHFSSGGSWNCGTCNDCGDARANNVSYYPDGTSWYRRDCVWTKVLGLCVNPRWANSGVGTEVGPAYQNANCSGQTKSSCVSHSACTWIST